jgi:peptide/nickel transport system permease protein
MPGSTPASAAPEAPLLGASRSRSSWRGGAATSLGLGLTGLVVAVSLLAGRIAPGNPFHTSPPDRFRPPSAGHPMGTDQLGRDLFTGVVRGAHSSMSIVVGVVAISSVLGLVVGVMGGYRRGVVDDVAMRVIEVLQSVPRFFLAILVTGWFGTDASTLIVLLGLTSWPLLARVVRAETLSLREREFVRAARSLGARDSRIVVRHVLPNVAPSALVVIALTGSRVVLLEAGLAYLGLSNPNVPSWGALVNNAQPYLQSAWWMSVFPGGAIAVSVLGMNLLSEGLGRGLDPLDRGSGGR